MYNEIVDTQGGITDNDDKRTTANLTSQCHREQ